LVKSRPPLSIAQAMDDDMPFAYMTSQLSFIEIALHSIQPRSK
jgi:hypothetical protein